MRLLWRTISSTRTFGTSISSSWRSSMPATLIHCVVTARPSLSPAYPKRVSLMSRAAATRRTASKVSTPRFLSLNQMWSPSPARA